MGANTPTSFDAYVRAWDAPRQGKALQVLAGPSPDARKIRLWLKRHATQADHSDAERATREHGWTWEPWQAALENLAIRWVMFKDLSPLERASAQERREQARKIETLARKLAEAIHPWPDTSIIDLFDPNTTAAINKTFPSIIRGLSSPLLAQDPDDPGYPLALVDCIERQSLPNMLQRLADNAHKKAFPRLRDLRPRTGNPNARVFARYMADHFRSAYGKQPDEVLAACVALRFPSLSTPPTAETIRAWRGSR